MYKLKIIDGIAVAKTTGVSLGENEYEVTSAQFVAAKLPCSATVASGAVTLGDQVEYTRMAVTVKPAHVPTEEEVRGHRDNLLADTDYTQMPDSPLTDDCKADFAVYRQGLRDVTDQAGFPGDVEWPEMPSAVNTAIE